MTAQGVEKVLKNIVRLSVYTTPDKARPHALRRTFACNLIADGIDIKMVAELMGHKNIEVTHKYYTQYAIEKRKKLCRILTLRKSIKIEYIKIYRRQF